MRESEGRCPSEDGLEESDRERESGVLSRGGGCVRSYPSSISLHGGLLFAGGTCSSAGAAAGAGVASGRGQPSELTVSGTIGEMTAIAGGAAANMGVDAIEDVPHDDGVPAIVGSYGGHCGVPVAERNGCGGEPYADDCGGASVRSESKEANAPG